MVQTIVNKLGFKFRKINKFDIIYIPELKLDKLLENLKTSQGSGMRLMHRLMGSGLYRLSENYDFKI